MNEGSSGCLWWASVDMYAWNGWVVYQRRDLEAGCFFSPLKSGCGSALGYVIGKEFT